MEEKTYIFPDANAGKGVDPNVLALMNNGGMGGMNNPFWAIILLAFLRNGFGGNWDGGNGNTGFVASQLNQAIAGNANALSNLATSLNCTEGQIQSAIAGVQAAIQQTANANNMSTMQVVNAINSGNAGLANQLQSCCCNVENAVNTGFGNLRYENAAQTCSVKQSIADQTATVISKLDAIEDSRKDREIASLTAQLTAATSRAERQAELAPIYKQLNDIACRQPNTVTIPANNGVLVPSCVAWQMGLHGFGVNPFVQGGSIWS